MNLSNTALVVRNDLCVWRRVDDEIAILIPGSKKMTILNEIGGVIWELASEPISIAEIVDRITSEYDANIDLIEADVVSFISSLLEAGIMINSVFQMQSEG